VISFLPPSDTSITITKGAKSERRGKGEKFSFTIWMIKVSRCDKEKPEKSFLP
jgi:hypothetical protein